MRDNIFIYLPQTKSLPNNITTFCVSIIQKAIGDSKIPHSITKAEIDAILNIVAKLNINHQIYFLDYICDTEYNLSERGTRKNDMIERHLLSDRIFAPARDILWCLSEIENPFEDKENFRKIVAPFEEKYKVRIFVEEEDCDIKKERREKLKKIFGNDSNS